MIVQDVLDNIILIDGYILNSIFLKSFNNNGCVYKFLLYVSKSQNIANRKEIFIATNPEDSNLDIENRRVIITTYIEPAL